MDIERLKELKDHRFILSDIGEDLIGTGVTRSLIALLDEAIARQSVKSEEVAEAIEWVTNTRHRNQYMSGDWTAPMGNHINRTIQDTIITALQAYQPKPESTTEDVQRAINDLDESYRHALRFENTYIDLPILTKTSQLAITALQAYQPKNPCVICENGDDEFVCFEDDGERIKNEAEARAIIARGEQYCRFCGRPLKGDNA